MSIVDSGVEYLEGLRYGFPELAWLQGENLANLQDHLLNVFNQEYGWTMAYTSAGEPDVGWRVRSQSGGKLRLQSQLDYATEGPTAPYQMGVSRRAGQRVFAGLDQDGRIMALPVVASETLTDVDGIDIQVPDDGVWRTLLARYKAEPRERGSLNLTAGSVTVTGTDTQFTRLFDGTAPRAVRLRISTDDSSNGNDGYYTIATITDDNNMTLTTPAPATETGVGYRVMGEFFSGVPADPDIHRRPSIAWELVARTVFPPTNGLISFDVMFDSGSSTDVQIVDRRSAQMARRRDPNVGGFFLAFTGGVSNDNALSLSGNTVDDVTYVALANCLVGASTDAGAALGGVDVSASGQLVAYAQEDGIGGHDIILIERIPFAYVSIYGPDHAAGPVTLFNTGATYPCSGLALAPIPRNTGTTHLLFYTLTNGNLYYRATTDNGASASWGGATLVFTPDTGDTVQNPRAILTRLGRLIVVFEYTDASEAITSIRCVYSDDHGATWATNSADAYTIMLATVDLHEPDIAEDDDGVIWTVWRRGDDRVRLAMGGGLNDPVPAGLTAQQPEFGFIVNQQNTAAGSTTFAVRRPCLLPGPGGQIHVFYQYANTTAHTATLHCAVVSMGRTIRSGVFQADPLVDTTDVSPLPDYADFALVPQPGGTVAMAFGINAAAPAGGVYLVEYPVCVTQRNASWLGGR